MLPYRWLAAALLRTATSGATACCCWLVCARHACPSPGRDDRTRSDPHHSFAIRQGTQTIKWLGLAAAARFGELNNRCNEFKPTAVGAAEEKLLFHPKNLIIDHVADGATVLVEVRGASDSHPPNNAAWQYLAFEDDRTAHIGVPTDFTWDQELSGTAGISVYLKIEGRDEPIQMTPRSHFTSQYLAIVTLVPGTYQYYFLVNGKRETAKNQNFVRASDSKSPFGRVNWIEVLHPGVAGIDGFQYIARNIHEQAIVVKGEAEKKGDSTASASAAVASETAAAEAAPMPTDTAADMDAMVAAGGRKGKKKGSKKKKKNDLLQAFPNETDPFVREVLLEDSWLELSHVIDDLFQDLEVREEEIAAMRRLFQLNFDFLRNLFLMYSSNPPGSEGADESVPFIELRNVWRMMKDCAIPSETLHLSHMDEILISTVQGGGEAHSLAPNCHIVDLEYTFFQWLEGIVKGARKKFSELGAF